MGGLTVAEMSDALGPNLTSNGAQITRRPSLDSSEGLRILHKLTARPGPGGGARSIAPVLCAMSQPQSQLKERLPAQPGDRSSLWVKGQCMGLWPRKDESQRLGGPQP